MYKKIFALLACSLNEIYIFYTHTQAASQDRAIYEIKTDLAFKNLQALKEAGLLFYDNSTIQWQLPDPAEVPEGGIHVEGYLRR